LRFELGLEGADAVTTTPTPEAYPHWTADPDTGVANSSVEFLFEWLIRNDAYALLSGAAGKTARLIVAQLAHKYRLGPWDLAVTEGRRMAAADIRSTIIAGSHPPQWAVPGARPRASDLQEWAATIAEGRTE
jgi:hypothetical protein